MSSHKCLHSSWCELIDHRSHADTREESKSIHRADCCSNHCPAHPHPAVHCSIDRWELDSPCICWSSDHCTNQIKSFSLFSCIVSIKQKKSNKQTKKSYLFHAVNFRDPQTGKHKNLWWVVDSTFWHSPIGKANALSIHLHPEELPVDKSKFKSTQFKESKSLYPPQFKPPISIQDSHLTLIICLEAVRCNPSLSNSY